MWNVVLDTVTIATCSESHCVLGTCSASSTLSALSVDRSSKVHAQIQHSSSTRGPRWVRDTACVEGQITLSGQRGGLRLWRFVISQSLLLWIFDIVELRAKDPSPPSGIRSQFYLLVGMFPGSPMALFSCRVLNDEPDCLQIASQKELTWEQPVSGVVRCCPSGHWDIPINADHLDFGIISRDSFLLTVFVSVLLLLSTVLKCCHRSVWFIL